MNTQNNGPSLTGVVDIIANNISLFLDNGTVKNINDIFINENDISTAEPYDVQIDENGNTIQMYQFTGNIDDTKIPGLESILNYMNENLFSKDEPAVNENYYNITKKHFNEDIQNIYNIDKSKTFNIKHHRYTDDYYYNKKQFINNNIINNNDSYGYHVV